MKTDAETHQPTDLLDTIILNDDTKLKGVVDYVSNKQVYLFDFTQEQNRADYICLVMMWKGANIDTRFSVWCLANYPLIRLPRAILVPRNNIRYTDKPLIKTKKAKQRRTSIKSNL